MLMPPLTYIHASEAARTTAGGRVAEAMQKVCETIGLFNAEYLAVSEISINITHTQLALLAQTTLLIFAQTRVNIRLSLHSCKGDRIVFFPIPPGEAAACRTEYLLRITRQR